MATKTIALFDTHGTQYWKWVVNTQTFDKIVLIGDYFDDLDISGTDQLSNFLDIMEYKKNNPDKMICLIGNHDHHYFQSVGDSGTSGYQARMAPQFSFALEENKQYLQMAYKEGEFLFTHAGVTPTWLNNVLGKDGWKIETIDEHINEIWKYKPKAFCFSDDGPHWSDPSGDDVWQSPIWVRPYSLMKDGKELKKHIIQVVGHTRMKTIDGQEKMSGGRYWFIDTHKTSKEYIVVEDGKITIEKVNV